MTADKHSKQCSLACCHMLLLVASVENEYTLTLVVPGVPAYASSMPACMSLCHVRALATSAASSVTSQRQTVLLLTSANRHAPMSELEAFPKLRLNAKAKPLLRLNVRAHIGSACWQVPEPSHFWGFSIRAHMGSACWLLPKPSQF